ncbi:MAG: DUF3341 domain-containing protein [Deltaproteobacteria bacterium]|nr:DUF3341 domain-containing protein [Deltaproteobacteria bacterium]
MSSKSASPSGVVGLFADPHELIAGATAVRQARYDGCDAFTPYPVHGIDTALGLKKSWVSATTLVFGILGCFAGLYFQIWTSGIDWPINVGGKPLASVPAFIPITFECTVLFGGIATFLAALGFCGLLRGKKAIVDPRVTDDTFALWVPARSEERIREAERLLREHGAYEIRTIA